MRTTQYLLSTLKETPADAEVLSHQLMLRAGMIRKLASGLYTWLPSGLRVLRKVEHIVREEMEKAGAIEVLMPIVQPADLWQESGRWEQFGPELLRVNDRHERPFALGPTHEEVITELVRKEVSSYKQLPLNLFQIQTKFRDEVRPRFGVMRAREFTMKDAYSFHLTDECLQATYDNMFKAYCAIFDRLGLDYRPVLADTGSIGGSVSHEFHVLAESGEDAIVFSSESDYAANIEKAECGFPPEPRPAPTKDAEKLATAKVYSIADLCQSLSITAQQTVKTILVKGQDEDGNESGLVALVLRGDHELNDVKAENLEGVLSPLTLATDEEAKAVTNCAAGAIGPVDLGLDIIVDRTASHMADFVCGANENGFSLSGVNWEKDCSSFTVADIRNIVAGDPSPCGKGVVSIKRGIEVGHIFQLGRKYSEAMKAGVLTETGKHDTLTMGCYGVGVSRIVAAAIEQNNDDNGIQWPNAIAPFQVVVLPMNMHKSHRIPEIAENFYSELKQAGIDVIFDDRKERPGVMFADWELLGVPHSIVIGERNLDEGVVEYKSRVTGEKEKLKIEDVVEFIKAKLT